MTARTRPARRFRIGDRVIVTQLDGRTDRCLRRGSHGIVIDGSAEQVAVWFEADQVEYLRPEQLWPLSIPG
jgi:hypothetical protein